MKILVSYRGIPQSRGWSTGDCVVRAFRALGHDVIPYGNYYQTHERLEKSNVFAEDWDLYLQMECGDGDPFYSELANIRSRKVASWWFDIDLYPQKWATEIRLLKSEFNFVANKKYSQYDDSYYLPYGACESIHFRAIKEKEIDFLIIGSARPERMRLYEAIREIPNVKVSYINNKFREEYIDILSSAKYVINDIAGGGQGLLAMRPFETIAAGSSLITPEDDGCKLLGIPCFEYKDEEDLMRLCSVLNTLPDFANPSLQKEFLSNHSYKARCQTILETVFPNERI